MQSEKSVSAYKVNKINYTKFPLRFDERHQLYFVDVSKNIGKIHEFEEFNFYTTYKMWLGPVAIQKFGRERILSFKEAVRLKEVGTDIIEVQLCDHIDQCNSPENIRRQKCFLHHLGIEEYPEHELTGKSSGLKGWLNKWL